MGRLLKVLAILAVAALAADYLHIINLPRVSLRSLAPGGESSRNCRIKGNISIDSGERIYHVPGGLWYDKTVISELYGERWFCSEAEARAAGWRKSYE